MVVGDYTIPAGQYLANEVHCGEHEGEHGYLMMIMMMITMINQSKFKKTTV